MGGVVYVYPRCLAGNSEGHWLSALRKTFLRERSWKFHSPKKRWESGRGVCARTALYTGWPGAAACCTLGVLSPHLFYVLCPLSSVRCPLPSISIPFSWTVKSAAPPPSPFAVRWRKPNSSRQVLSPLIKQPGPAGRGPEGLPAPRDSTRRQHRPCAGTTKSAVCSHHTKHRRRRLGEHRQRRHTWLKPNIRRKNIRRKLVGHYTDCSRKPTRTPRKDTPSQGVPGRSQRAR
jgi:hypothetical protein